MPSNGARHFTSSRGDYAAADQPVAVAHDRMLLRLAQLAASIDAAHRRVGGWTWEDDTSPRERHRWIAFARALVAAMADPTSYMLRRMGTGMDRDTAATVWRAMVGAILEETPDEWRPR